MLIHMWPFFLKKKNIYLCPPPGMWCLCHFQLKPWKLPAYQRGLRCTAGSLWSHWKSKPEVGRATHPIKRQTYCEEGKKAQTRLKFSISLCGFRPAPVWLPSEVAGQHVWLQVAALETACLPRISILPPQRAEEHACTEILANLKDRVCQSIRFVNYSDLTSSNFLVLARSHTWFNIRTRLFRPQSGWSSWNQTIISTQNITLVCLYDFFSLHTLIMSDVMINSDDRLSLCLFGGRGVPNPKIPFTLSRRLSLLDCLFIVGWMLNHSLV